MNIIKFVKYIGYINNPEYNEFILYAKKYLKRFSQYPVIEESDSCYNIELLDRYIFHLWFPKEWFYFNHRSYIKIKYNLI